MELGRCSVVTSRLRQVSKRGPPPSPVFCDDRINAHTNIDSPNSCVLVDFPSLQAELLYKDKAFTTTAMEELLSVSSTLVTTSPATTIRERRHSISTTTTVTPELIFR